MVARFRVSMGLDNMGFQWIAERVLSYSISDLFSDSSVLRVEQAVAYKELSELEGPAISSERGVRPVIEP